MRRCTGNKGVHYFNFLAARVYRKQLRTLDGRGVLFAVADDVTILGPPEVIKEIS